MTEQTPEGTTLSYCETIAATGPWHIRALTRSGRKPTGGADTPTLCGLQAAWDVGAAVFEFRPHDDTKRFPGNTCQACAALLRKGEL